MRLGMTHVLHPSKRDNFLGRRSSEVAMRRERATRIGVCVLLLAAVALTGCRVAEHSRRAAIDAFASFVLDSVFRMQAAAPLEQARSGGVGGARTLPPRPLATLGVTAPAKPHTCIPDPTSL